MNKDKLTYSVEIEQKEKFVLCVEANNKIEAEDLALFYFSEGDTGNRNKSGKEVSVLSVKEQ
jgi:hypothetical protein